MPFHQSSLISLRLNPQPDNAWRRPVLYGSIRLCSSLRGKWSVGNVVHMAQGVQKPCVFRWPYWCLWPCSSLQSENIEINFKLLLDKDILHLEIWYQFILICRNLITCINSEVYLMSVLCACMNKWMYVSLFCSYFTCVVFKRALWCPHRPLLLSSLVYVCPAPPQFTGDLDGHWWDHSSWHSSEASPMSLVRHAGSCLDTYPDPSPPPFSLSLSLYVCPPRPQSL